MYFCILPATVCNRDSALNPDDESDHTIALSEAMHNELGRRTLGR